MAELSHCLHTSLLPTLLPLRLGLAVCFELGSAVSLDSLAV